MSIKVYGPGIVVTGRGPTWVEILNKIGILNQREGVGIMTEFSRLITTMYSISSIVLFFSWKEGENIQIFRLF